ncbi:glycosyltransferase, partial [Candidatus Microgenomates bacterium]|nr:glycosyltransferase [Candidatus Microgenomates bacterium]
MNISIVIPTYNNEKILKRNLPKVLDAVRDYKKGNVEIIIADDPSTDNTPQVINNFIASISEKHVIGKTIANKNKKENGFSKNVNRGVDLATGDILILLNSDVIPHKDFLYALLPHFIDPKVFAVGCMDESIEDGKTVLRGRGIGRWHKGLLMHGEGALDKTNTLWVSGGSAAFRKSLWDKLRGLDPLFNPFYWEDIDLSYRALKSGYQIVFEKNSVVTHEHEEGTIKKKFKPDHVRKIVYRNQFFFVWKNITDTSLLLSHLFWLPYHLINGLRGRDWV